MAYLQEMYCWGVTYRWYFFWFELCTPVHPGTNKPCHSFPLTPAATPAATPSFQRWTITPEGRSQANPFSFTLLLLVVQLQLRVMFLTLPMSVFFFFFIVDCIPSCKGIGKVFACGLVPKPKRCSANSLEILQEGSAWYTSSQRRKPVAKETIRALFSVEAWLYSPCCLHWSKEWVQRCRRQLWGKFLGKAPLGVGVRMMGHSSQNIFCPL